LTGAGVSASLCAVPITELRIEGLRTIEKMRLRFDGLTVLIGENGTGKSSILEACEILRRATGPRFMDELYGIHGGLTALLREGSDRLLIGVTVRPETAEYDAPELWQDELQKKVEYIEYDLVLVPRGSFALINESLRVKPISAPGGQRKVRSTVEVFSRLGGIARQRHDLTHASESVAVDDNKPCVATVSPHLHFIPLHYQCAQRVAAYLANIRVNLPFETTPTWAARALDRKSSLRATALLTPADHLEPLGLNLASSLHALKNNFGRAHWDKTLEYVRLGLGERIEDVITWADPGGGNIGLSLKLAGLDRAIPAAQISDGMLSYLAFVALFRLHVTKPSLVAFDEPDLHLHPSLLMRVLDMFESLARDCPVLLATHSDRLLDGLTDPARSVVLCELDDRGATHLIRPDPEALAKWLERYRGLGDIRSAGHAASVMTREEPAG
jgi:predicted ATPase